MLSQRHRRVGHHDSKYTLCLKQETQLSQRDRAMLRVIKYFTKSLQVTQDHWK